MADCLENLSASAIHVKSVQEPGSHTRWKVVVSMSNSSIFIKTQAAKCPPGETQSNMKKKKRTPSSKNKKGTLVQHEW